MNKEDFGGLLYELPDFIEGKITDELLRSKIISLINEDENFRKEYELLKNSMNTIRNIKTDIPGNEYFSNLTMNINRKIDEKYYNSGIWEKLQALFINWKFATVFSVLLIAVIFYKSGLLNRDSGNYLIENKSELTQHNGSNNVADTVMSIDEEAHEFIDFDEEDDFTDAKLKNKKSKNQIKNNGNNDITDYSIDEFGETQLFNSGDNFSIEEEFEKLTPNQQKEFLKNLENLKL